MCAYQDSEPQLRIGVVLPQHEMGGGLGAIVEYVREAERLGFDHLTLFEHVLGVDKELVPDWGGLYDVDVQFREPFMLAAYLAAVTSRIEITAGVVVLSQRPAALVAKQLAEAVLFTQGRFRFGVGIGWNRPELEALGMTWAARGARMEEQISIIRMLLSQRSVRYQGRFHALEAVGISPRPATTPAVWIGGGYGASEITFRRIGTLGEGWISNIFLDSPDGPAQAEHALQRIRSAVAARGGDPQRFPVNGVVHAAPSQLDRMAADVAWWRSRGASHVTLEVAGDGLSAPAQLKHLGTLARAVDVRAADGGATLRP